MADILLDTLMLLIAVPLGFSVVGMIMWMREER